MHLEDTTFSQLATAIKEKPRQVLDTAKSIQELSEQASVELSLFPFENPFKIASIEQDRMYLQKKSKFSWVRIKPDVWMISISLDSCLILDANRIYFYFIFI